MAHLHSKRLSPIAGEALSLGDPELADFIERAAARLSVSAPQLPLDFRFRFRDTPFIGRISAGGQTCALRLVANLGPLPYSAEDAAARGRLLALAEASLPIGRFAISLDGHLLHGAEAALNPPVTGTAIVAAAARLILTARPYLELARNLARPD